MRRINWGRREADNNMSNSHCFIVGIFLSLFVLAIAFSGVSRDEGAFKWAVEFCNGKDKIKSFSTKPIHTVMCVDNRNAEIP